MSLWSWWKRGKEEPAEPAARPDAGTVEEPDEEAPSAEPYVFECGACGKVFESRRRRPLCPECDSAEVSRLG